MEPDYVVIVAVALHVCAWVAGVRFPPPWTWYVGVPLVASGGYVVAVGCGLEAWQAGVVFAGLVVLQLILRCFVLNPVGFGVIAFGALYQMSHPGSTELRWALGLSFSSVLLVGTALYAFYERSAGPVLEWWSVTLQTSLIGFGLPIRALFSLVPDGDPQWLPPFDGWIVLIGGVFGAVRWYWQVRQSAKVNGFELVV